VATKQKYLMQYQKLLSKIIFYIIFSIPFLTSLKIFCSYALNVPFEDDFVILRGLYDIGIKNDLKEQFNILIAPCNEHSIIISKIFFGLHLWFLKSINFKNLMFVGNLLFYSIFIFFYSLLKKHKISIWALLPIPYILLSAHVYENSLWAMCAFENNDVVVFLCWAIFLIFSITPSKTKFYFGLFLLGCALICNGNGILSFVVVGIGLFYQRRWQELIIVIATLLIMKLVFLSGGQYKTPNSIITTISSFSILVGGFLKTSSLNNIIKLIGFGMILAISGVALMYVFKRKKDIFELNIILLSLFCLGTLLAVALFRDVVSSDFPDRYRLYPQLLLICIYLLLIIYFKQKTKHLIIAATLISCLYFLQTFYVTYPNILNSYQKRNLLSVNWKNNGSTLNGGYYRLYFDETLGFYEKNKTYLCENPIFDIKTAKVVEKPIEILVENLKNGHLIRIKNLDCSQINSNNAYFLTLENDKHQLYFLPVFHIRNSIGKALRGQGFLINEIYANIMYAEIPADTYRIGLVSNISSKTLLYLSNNSITTQKVGYNQ
jgi:hypothetical protein